MAQDLQTTMGNVGNAITSFSNAANTASNLISNISNADSLGSAIRGINIPAAGEAIGDIMSSIASFSDSNSDDWRVRLSLPKWSSFRTSPVLSPLNAAGGLIFPYTPIVQLDHSAKYNPVSPTHSNYSFHAYQNSDPGKIIINAPMPVEDSTQALYWIAAVHYLRSMTKMFSGADAKAGNPPPIVYLNGYGNYVLKNIPVVVTGFTTTLPNDCDYIGCNVSGSMAGEIAGIADSFGGLSSTIGGLATANGQTIAGLSGITSSITNMAGGVSQVAGVFGSLGLGGTTSGGVAHVPTNSQFTVTLQPVYSRDSVRKFSLDRFVTGGYLNGAYGFI